MTYCTQLKKTAYYRIDRLDTRLLSVWIMIMRETLAEHTVLTASHARPVVVHKLHKQLTLVAGGSGDAILNGEVNRLYQGDFVIFERGVSHAFVAQSRAFDLYHWHFRDQTDMADRYILP